MGDTSIKSGNVRPALFHLVSPPFPCGVAWLVNVLLELELKTTNFGPDYKNSHWRLDDSGNHQIHPHAREHLRWHLPAIEQNATFHFEPNLEIHWEHRLDFARRWHRPTILFTRDGRDAVYSHYRRHHAESELFKNFLTVSSEWPDHFPKMFNLPPAETWGLFNLYWLELSKVIPVHTVRFEDTKTDPVAVVKGVLNFLGVARPLQEIQRAIESSTFKAAQQQEEKVANSSGQQIRGNHRRGQPYEWREHFTEKDLAAFDGIADEALRKLGYSTLEKSTNRPAEVEIQVSDFISEQDAEVRQAIQECDLPKAAQLLLKRAEKNPDEDSLLHTLAERKAIEWTHKIFNNELGRSRVADTARNLFTRILRDYAKSKSIRKLLNKGLSLQPVITQIGSHRGYLLVQIRRTYYAFSPALGPSFRIADQDEETITQLALEGKCYLHSNLLELKTAVDTLLNEVLKKAEKLSSSGEDAEAIELLKSCISLTGAKDDRTLNLANLLTNPKNQRISA